jgi:hypothetical protein
LKTGPTAVEKSKIQKKTPQPKKIRNPEKSNPKKKKSRAGLSLLDAHIE